jgi:hypothetical protein
MFSVRHEYSKISGNNEKAKSKFDTAIQYLKSNSSLAKMLLEELEGCPKTIEVVIVSGDGMNGWRGPKVLQSNSGGRVDWYPDRVKAAGNRSAALALMHELGHAYQFLSNKDWLETVMKGRYGKLWRPWRGDAVADRMKDPEIAAKIDDPNIELIETEVAKQLNTSNNAAEGSVAFEPIRASYL